MRARARLELLNLFSFGKSAFSLFFSSISGMEWNGIVLFWLGVFFMKLRDSEIQETALSLRMGTVDSPAVGDNAESGGLFSLNVITH